MNTILFLLSLLGPTPGGNPGTPIAPTHPSSTPLHLNDNTNFSIGNTAAAPDYWCEHDTAAAPDELACWTTDADGGGTNAKFWSVKDGTDDLLCTGGLTLGGDLNMSGYDVISPDDYYWPALAAHTDPHTVLIKAQDHYIGVDGAGADVIIAGGIAAQIITVSDTADAAGDAIVVTIYNHGVATTVTMTDAVAHPNGWVTCVGLTNAQCALSIYTAWAEHGPAGLLPACTDGTCSDGKVYFSVMPTVAEGLVMSITNNAADPFGTKTTSGNGTVRIVGPLALTIDNLNLGGNDAVDTDDTYQTTLAADTLPRSTLIMPQHAWSQSTTAANYVGANLILGGSIGASDMAFVAAGSAGNTVVITHNASQVGAAATATTYTADAGGWTCSTVTNAQCACNLYVIIIATPVSGWTVQRADGTCSDAKLYFQPDPTTWLMTLTETGATFTATQQKIGSVLLSDGTANNPSLGFASDDDGTGAGFYRYGANNPGVSANGSIKMKWGAGTPGSTEHYNVLDQRERVYNGAAALNLGNAPTIGHGGVTGSVAIGKDAGNVSLEIDGTSFFDSAATFYSTVTHEGNTTFSEDKSVIWGTSDMQWLWSSTQTPDTFMLGLGADSNHMVFAEKADIATDFALPIQTNPTLDLQSADATKVYEGMLYTYSGAISRTSAAAADNPDVVFGTGSQTNAGDYDSGDWSVVTGATTTDGLSGSVILASGVAGAGIADAGDIVFAVNGAPGVGTTVFTIDASAGGDIAIAGTLKAEVSTGDAPAEPHACDAAHAGVIAAVDDTDDTAYNQPCICLNLDGTGYDWRQLNNVTATACPSF